MRVIAGSAKGRPLKAPAGDATRPTSDRVREATFASLGSLLGLGWEEDARVLDLFAGSGALGIEALSRGAAHVTFVDHHRASAAAIRSNVSACGFGARSRIVTADAFAWLGSPAPDEKPFELAFCDPPYAFEAWDRLLGVLVRWTPLVVLESDRDVAPGAGWDILRVKRHGTTVVSVVRTSSPDAAHSGPGQVES